MTQSIIGANAPLRYLKAYQAHVDYWRTVNPAYQLAMVDKPEHAPYIQEYAAALSDSMIVARIHHDIDGGFHTKPTGANDTRYYVSAPAEYHNAYGWLGRINNVILNVMNEPDGFADDDTINRLVHWMTDYISVATREKTKSVLFNWGDRQPRIIENMMDGRFDIVLQLMALHPELFYMGMHMYGPDEITTHIESYVARCERLGIIPPRVIATEFGFDKTNGNASGYRSRRYSGGAYAAWQIEQVQHELAPYIKRGVLVGLNVFQEGNSGGWDAFDVENDKDYKDEIKRAALAGELEPVPTKPFLTPVSKPADAASAIKIRVKNAEINVRSGPSTDYTKADILSAGDEVTLYQTPFKQDKSGGVWRWVDISTALGGWVCTDVLSYVDITPPPVILPPPTPPVTTYTVTLTAEEYAAWLAFRSAMERAAVQTLSVKVDAAA